MNNPTRNKKTLRTILFLFVLAMLAHLCSAQLLHGEEKFIRGDRLASGVTVELRSEAIVVGAEVRFRQVARWADADKDAFEPIGDLVVARFGDKQGFMSIGVTEIRNLLRDAGVNVAMMNFAGSMSCALTRSEAKIPQEQKLQQIAGIKAPAAPEIVEKSLENAPKSLRELLADDLASCLRLPVEALQIGFRGQDEKLLRLSEPQLQFTVEPQRTGNLGEVSWNVLMTSDAGTSRAFIVAHARAWQEQLVAVRPLATKQLISEADVIERRALVDRIGDDPLLKRDQVVGQTAARDLKPGAVMTARLVDAVQLVRPGQFVTIEHGQGAIKVKIVARAIDGGCYGQAIRVKNESTREVFRVTVIGPQQASLNGVTG